MKINRNPWSSWANSIVSYLGSTKMLQMMIFSDLASFSSAYRQFSIILFLYGSWKHWREWSGTEFPGNDWVWQILTSAWKGRSWATFMALVGPTAKGWVCLLWFLFAEAITPFCEFPQYSVGVCIREFLNLSWYHNYLCTSYISQ